MARRRPKQDVFRWFIKRSYACQRRVVHGGTRYIVFLFELYDLDELDWVQSIWSAIGAHMFARAYDPEQCIWDCEMRVPMRKSVGQQEGNDAADIEDEIEEVHSAECGDAAGVAAAPSGTRQAVLRGEGR